MSRTLKLVVFAAALLVQSLVAQADPPSAPPAPAPAPAATAVSQPGPSEQAAPSNDDKPIFPPNFKPAGPGTIKPTQRAAESSGLSTLTATAVPLAVVVAVIIVASLLFRRAVKSGGSLAAAVGAGGRAPAGLLEVLGRYPIARGQTLVLLKLDQRVLLLSQTQATRGHPGGFTTLSEIADPADVASILTKVSETEQTGPAARFNALLAEADSAHEAPRPAGLGRLRSMLGQQPVSWQEPEPVAPTQGQVPESPAPTMRLTGVDTLRSRIAAMRPGTSGGAR